MHDKLDFIWDKSTSQIVNQEEVRNKLKQRKFDRVVLNNKQAKIYNQLLHTLGSRKVQLTSENESYQKVHESERQFLDAFKTMIESGYALTEQDFLELLDLIEVREQVKTVH